MIIAPLPTIAANGPTTFCQGNSVGLTSSNGAGYLWSNNQTTQTILASNAGNYSVAVTDQYGCVKTSGSTVVTHYPLPAANPGLNTSICLYASAPIGSLPVPGNTYSWTSIPSGFASTISNPTVNPLVTTTYYLTETITVTGCSKTNSVVVTVNPLPAAAAGANRAICLNASTQLGS